MLRRNPSRNNRGFTLLEMVIVMMIIGLISIPLSTFIIKAWTSYAFLQTQSDTSAELGTLSERIARVVRGTTGIVDAEPNTLTIYAYFSPQDTVVKQVRYFISGTNLEVGVTPPTGTAPNYTYDPSTESVKVIRTDLAMNSTPLFTYYDDVGNQLSGSFQTSQIKQIGFYLGANGSNTSLQQPIALQTRVTLRNFKTNL